MLLGCWESDPHRRPDFKQIIEQLESSACSVFTLTPQESFHQQQELWKKEIAEVLHDLREKEKVQMHGQQYNNNTQTHTSTIESEFPIVIIDIDISSLHRRFNSVILSFLSYKLSFSISLSIYLFASTFVLTLCFSFYQKNKKNTNFPHLLTMFKRFQTIEEVSAIKLPKNGLPFFSFPARFVILLVFFLLFLVIGQNWLTLCCCFLITSFIC